MIGNPFAADIFPDGLPVAGGPTGVHAEAYAELKQLVDRASQRLQSPRAEDGGGTVVLLRAARAGFGKSHLLARLSAELSHRAFVVAVPFDREREAQWSALLWQVMETFHQGRAEKLSLLDLVTRRLFAIINQRLIVEKIIPCAHPRESLEALERQFVDLFDFTNPAQPVARWFAEHFERLMPFAAQAAADIAGLAPEAAAHWLRVLIAYAQGGAEGETVRWEALRWSVLQPAAQAFSHGEMTMVSSGVTGEAGAREKVTEFCRLAAAVRPLVLVFDELDLFYGHSAAVQRIAGFISELRRLLSRAVHVLSVNQDLWQQTFQPAIPSAIEDRLTGSQITLGSLHRAESEHLIRSRLRFARASEETAAAFLQRLNLSAYFAQEAGRLVSPRAILRHAARVWDEFERSRPSHPPAPEADYRPQAFLEIPDFTPSPAVALKVEEAPAFRFPEATEGKPPEPAMRKEPEIIPAPEADPAFARLRETLQRLLSPLPPEPAPQVTHAAAKSRPEFVSGVILPDPQAQQPLAQRLPAPQPQPPTREAILQHRFHQLRTHFLTAPWLSVDQDRLFHLLKIAGHRLAVVKWKDYPLPGSPGQSAGAWVQPGGETLFGSEPYEDRTYWSSLVHFARQRSAHEYQGRAAGSAFCRLVVFSATKAPVNLAAWMPPDEIIDARTHFLDVRPVDQSILATLYAADELMRDAARGAFQVSQEETFAALVPHLEFLWRQMMTPAPA
jgi:hypothetical protein